MTVSGTLTVELDIAQIIEEAFERAGVDVQMLNAGHMRSARRSLYLMFNAWINKGIRLWAVDEQSFTTTVGDADVTLEAGTIDVLDVFIRRDSVDTPMERISQSDYVAIPTKSTQGKPNRYWVHRTTPAPVMYLFQAPENATDTIVYWRLRRLYDVVTSAETADVPINWLDAVCAGLALRLYMKKPEEKRSLAGYTIMKGEAESSFEEAAIEDRDRSSTYIGPAGGEEL